MKFKISGKKGWGIHPMFVCEEKPDGFECVFYEHSENGKPRLPALVITNNTVGTIEVTSKAPAKMVDVELIGSSINHAVARKVNLSW